LNFPPLPPTCDDNYKIEYALDDAPSLLYNMSCLETIMLCEDENDKLVVSDDALIHESPISFLKSLIYTT
jgi:hypothetical protein